MVTKSLEIAVSAHAQCTNLAKHKTTGGKSSSLKLQYIALATFLLRLNRLLLTIVILAYDKYVNCKKTLQTSLVGYNKLLYLKMEFALY